MWITNHNHRLFCWLKDHTKALINWREASLPLYGRRCRTRHESGEFSPKRFYYKYRFQNKEPFIGRIKFGLFFLFLGILIFNLGCSVPPTEIPWLTGSATSPFFWHGWGRPILLGWDCRSYIFHTMKGFKFEQFELDLEASQQLVQLAQQVCNMGHPRGPKSCQHGCVL